MKKHFNISQQLPLRSFALVLFMHLITLVAFAQDKPLAPNVQSQIVNKAGVVQQVIFKETERPQLDQVFNVLSQFLETDSKVSFVKINSVTDKLGMQHEKFQQYYNGMPVEFAMYVVHAKGGNIISMNGEYYPMQKIGTTGSITSQNAIAFAKQHVKAEKYLEEITAHKHDAHDLGYDGPNPSLVVLPRIDGVNEVERLAYKLDIYAEEPLYRADVYVDAITGAVIFENNKIHHANVSGTGTTLYNGIQNFKADQVNTNLYRLQQTSSGNGVQTFSLNNGTNYGAATEITSASATFSANPIAVQAHWGAEVTHEYYLQKHGQNSYDGNGGILKSYVKFDNNYPNAFWNGSVMTYGDGDGTSIGPMVALDIVGHEITHGVISNSAGLVYSYESGALNESFADIFGELIENHGQQGVNDWLNGAAVYTNAGAFRSFSDPKSKLNPDTYQGQYWSTAASDNFGVHNNSGVQNKWFYILSQGETGTNDNNDSYSVTGIGMAKAADIAYRNLTVYLTPNSNFAAARLGAIQSAIDLYGAASPEVIATTDAWYAVGVGLPMADVTPPSIPLNLTLAPVTGNFADLSWNAATDNIGVVGYNVYKGTSLAFTTTNTNAMVNYLWNNTSYDLTVVAFDAAGNLSAPSNVVTFLIDAAAPTKPLNLTSANTTETTTDLSWTASTDNVGVVGYRIFQGATLLTTVPGTSTTVTGLSPSSGYYFRVQALDAAGNFSAKSDPVSITTLTPMAPCANGNVTLTINTDWYPEETSWAIRDNMNALVDSGGGYTNPQFASTAQFIETINLAPGNYTFTMYDTYGDGICCGGGYVLQSNVVIVSGASWNPVPPGNLISTPFCITTPADVTPPTTPTNLTSANTTQTTTDLSWTASTDNVGVTGYRVFQGSTMIITTTSTSYTVTGLSPGTTYDFTVEAIDAATNISGLSNIETVTTLAPPDVTPPTTPTNLTSANTTQTTTDLSWTASTDNVGVTGYRIFQGSTMIITTTSTSYTVTGLSPGTTYNFTVEAIDAAINISGLSNVETVTALSNLVMIHQGFFETGWDGWQDGGSDCKRVSSASRSYEGSRSIRIRDNSGTASSMTSPVFDLTPYDFVEVSFYFYPNSMENGEDFMLRYKNASGWSTLNNYTRGVDFNNNTFYHVVEVLPATAVVFSTNSQFRLQCDASGNADRIYIDQVQIRGVHGASNLTSGITSLGVLMKTSIEELPDGIYPNPVGDKLTFNNVDEDASYRIVDMSGKLILQGAFDESQSIDVSGISSGVYMLGIIDDEEAEYHKFIKR